MKKNNEIDEKIDKMLLNHLEESSDKKMSYDEFKTLYQLRNNTNLNKKEMYIKLISVCGTIGVSVLTLIAYDIWNKRGLKFEEHGSITSSTNRNLFSRLIPSK